MSTMYKPGERIVGPQRTQLATNLAARYEKGSSIRSLAEATGRSYGFVHRLLTDDANVTLRKRGGKRTKGK